MADSADSPRGSDPDYDAAAGVHSEASGAGLDSFDAEDERMLQNIGDHPLLERVQAALFKQLSDKLTRVEEELREKHEDAARAEQEREAVGVELYDVQQQLAQLQLSLDTVSGNAGTVAEARAKADEDLQTFQTGFSERKDHLADKESELLQYQQELNRINETLRQVEAYNKEVEAEIALSRRAAYKAEQEVSKAEEAKVRQDLHIDSLSERIKQARQRIGLYDAQIKAQREESTAAVDTLREAMAEMETIRVEKHSLMSQWQSALIAMKRRDEALAAAHAAIREQEEQFNSMTAEENNTRRLIREAQAKHAQAQEVVDKLDSELNWLESQLAALARQRDALEERHSMLQSSLVSTDAEAGRLSKHATELQKEQRSVAEARARVDRERQELETRLEEKASEHTTASVAARAAAREARRLLELVHQKEADRAKAENELARIKVDVLNTEAHNAALSDSLSALEAEVREKDALIAKYEMEIRQRQDAIEKKMHMVDRLNRKYEALAAAVPGEENMGPLEATIANLSKEIDSLRAESERLQKAWLSDQQELVARTSQVESKTTRLRELKSQYVLLDQKRVRLDNALSSQRKELDGLQVAIANMHDDMARINGLIAKNRDLSERLADSNNAAETEFANTLKEAELEASAMDRKLEALQGEKQGMLEELEELERQVAAWERKIQLEREMQEALDPTAGQSEVAGMEREIHRMRVRLDTLKRDQERLVREMERALEKHQDISIKYRNRKDGKVSGGGFTQAGLQRRVGALQRELQKKKERIVGYDAALEEQAAAAAAAEEEAAAAQAALQDVEQAVASTQKQVNAELFEKQKALEQAALLRRAAGKLQAVSRGAAQPLHAEDAAATAEAMAAEADAQAAAAQALIQDLAMGHPELGEVLGRVEQLLSLV